MHRHLSLMQREFTIHRAQRGEWIAIVLFYLIFTSLFPIALGAWSKTNTQLAPIIIWIGALVTTVLAQENLLRNDFKLGAFDAMLLSPQSFSLLMLIKIICHWCIYALPIVLLTPIIALSLGLSFFSIVIITLSLFFGTIFLSLMAAVGAALTVPLARGGVFLALLILPLYIPMLCLGCDLGLLSLEGIFSKGHFALLLALVIIALLFVPLVVAKAIKVSIE